MKLYQQENSPVDLYNVFNELVAKFLHNKLSVRVNNTARTLDIINHNLIKFFQYLEQEVFKNQIVIKVILYDVTANDLDRKIVYQYISGDTSGDTPLNFGYQYFQWNNRDILVANKL